MRILIKGAGDLASGAAFELVRAGHDVLMTEIPVPLAVRRMVSFCRAVYDGEISVQGLRARRVADLSEALEAQRQGVLPVLVDPEARVRESYRPDALVDGIMAKTNTGTAKDDAPRVIALGPGFTAGMDCDFVIETVRGPRLGAVISSGPAQENTGIPGDIGGYTSARLLRASADGVIEPAVRIGDMVKAGDPVAFIGGKPVVAQIDGVVRGMLQPGAPVRKGLKVGDVDPRGIAEYCYAISDKARRIGAGVLEALSAPLPGGGAPKAKTR